MQSISGTKSEGGGRIGYRYAVNSSKSGRYHIKYRAENGEWKHEYDVGTRHCYGVQRDHDPEGMMPRFLEDYMEDYEVVFIIEAGDGTYKRPDHDT